MDANRGFGAIFLGISKVIWKLLRKAPPVRPDWAGVAGDDGWVKDVGNIDCLPSQSRVSGVAPPLLSREFCKRPCVQSLSDEIQARELYSTRYVTCSFLSRNVKNSHRPVGSSTRLEQKLYNLLNVFTKHFICRCHRDDNPDQTSNADQVSANRRLLKEAWVVCFSFLSFHFAGRSKQLCFCLRGSSRNGVNRFTVSGRKRPRQDEQTKRQKSIDQCFLFSLHILPAWSDRRDSTPGKHLFVLTMCFVSFVF